LEFSCDFTAEEWDARSRDAAARLATHNGSVEHIVSDQVVEPDHYTRFVIEPVNFIMKNRLEFWQGSVIKYIMRCGHKVNQGETPKEAEIRDLQKATRYIEMRINQLRGKEPNDTTTK
jgi:hypothetical protein